MLRGALLRVWTARGGGFYGLGYLITFIGYEIATLAAELSESSSLAEFALGQIVELLIRFGFMSFINAFLALLWPLEILQLFEGMGIILLAGMYLGFEYALRPLVERAFPELAAHRLQVRAAKQAR